MQTLHGIRQGQHPDRRIDLSDADLLYGLGLATIT